MDIGTGVFLSAVFLGLIALYISTKDRWKWKKIILILIGLPITIGLLAGGGITSYKWFKETFPPTVKKQNGINKIMLGMTKDEVLYIKGKPSAVWSNFTPLKGNTFTFDQALEDGASEMDSNTWDYVDEYGDRLTIEFNNETSKVDNINCTKGESNYGNSCEIQDLKIGLSEDDLLRRLGKPEKSVIEDSVKKMYYPDLNLKFYLEKKEVYLTAISEDAKQ